MLTSVDVAPTHVLNQADRFSEATVRYGEALASGDGVALAFARRELAKVAWELAPQIHARLKCESTTCGGVIS